MGLAAACLLAGCSTGPSPAEMKKRIFEEARKGNAQAVADLLKKDPGLVRLTDPDPNGRKRTLLHNAGGKAVAELLLAQGAEVNARDRFGWTPLHAVPSAEVAALLIEKGADLNATAQRKLTPLHTTPSADVVRLLVDKGANLEALNDSGNAPLVWQLQSNRAEPAIALIEKGADVKHANKGGYTALHAAGDFSNVENAIAPLVEKGAEVNAVDKLGMTPLHYACGKNLTRTAQALIEKGADVNLKVTGPAAITTYSGGSSRQRPIKDLTPIQIAEDAELKALLRKHGATE